jgi:hypothetical protein
MTSNTLPLARVARFLDTGATPPRTKDRPLHVTPKGEWACVLGGERRILTLMRPATDGQAWAYFALTGTCAKESRNVTNADVGLSGAKAREAAPLSATDAEAWLAAQLAADAEPAPEAPAPEAAPAVDADVKALLAALLAKLA